MNYTAIYRNDLMSVQGIIPNIEKIRGKSILITGGTGLVCSAIVDFLVELNDSTAANITVYVASRNPQKAEERFGDRLWRPDIVYVEYDALKAVSWNFDVDFIIHGASPANPVLYVKQPVETMLANIQGLNTLLSYAKEHTVERVLFISSSEVYGNKESKVPYGEKEYGYVDILTPRACYPMAKRACETLCVSYYAEYGVNSVIARLGHIYGPTANRTDTRVSSQFFYDVLDGRDIVMKSDGLQLRSYCYVVDCVSAILTILINGVAGQSYNISNPDSVVTIRAIAEQIALRSGKRVILENPSDEEKKGYNMMDNSSLDSASLLDLGWNGFFDLEMGVEHTLKILFGERQKKELNQKGVS